MSSTQKPVTSEKKSSNRREQRAQAQSFIDSLQGEALDARFVLEDQLITLAFEPSQDVLPPVANDQVLERPA